MKQHGFSLSDLVQAVDFDKLALVQEGAKAMCVSEEVKKRFELMARELFKLFKYVEKQEVTDQYRAYKNAINVKDIKPPRSLHVDTSSVSMSAVREARLRRRLVIWSPFLIVVATFGVAYV